MQATLAGKFGASDLSSAIETYQNASNQRNAAFSSSVASAFGSFQLGVREDRLAGVTSSNPRYAAYAADVNWAAQTKSLRNQTITQYNAKQSDYIASVAGAQKSYNVNALASLLDAAGQAFAVNKTYAQQTASVKSTLELADYDAQDARARGYLTAYANEAIGAAAFESGKAQDRADAYSLRFAEVETAVRSARLRGDGREIVLKSADSSGTSVSLSGLAELKDRVNGLYASANVEATYLL